MRSKIEEELLIPDSIEGLKLLCNVVLGMIKVMSGRLVAY